MKVENIITSYYRQSSADLKIKKAQDNKTGIDFRIFILIFVENCLYFDAIHDFSDWLKIGFNPADSNRFRSHTENCINHLK